MASRQCLRSMHICGRRRRAASGRREACVEVGVRRRTASRPGAGARAWSSVELGWARRAARERDGQGAARLPVGQAPAACGQRRRWPGRRCDACTHARTHASRTTWKVQSSAVGACVGPTEQRRGTPCRGNIRRVCARALVASSPAASRPVARLVHAVRPRGYGCRIIHYMIAQG